MNHIDFFPATTKLAGTAPAPDLAPVDAHSDARPPVPADAPLARPDAKGDGGPYTPAAGQPTQSGPEEIRFDFNEGARLLLPARAAGLWRARLSDVDSGNVLFETDTRGGLIRSSKRWFVRFRIEVAALDADGERLVLDHVFDARNREILIQFPVGALGDSIAWLSYACRFGEAHPGAKVTIAMAPALIPLVRGAYPDIAFVTPAEVVSRKLTHSAYATYHLGLFFTDRAHDWQPVDFRHVGLHKTAAHILGTDLAERPPRLALADDSRPLAEPYVAIAVQATSAAKMWNNPHGWRETIANLKRRGYRVICIDQKPVHGQGVFWSQIPHGCEDFTGLSLEDAARYLRHAELFIGLSSGLSWLAWAAGCACVLISGFSLPSTEFETRGRVINWHVCNGCWNDPAETFDHKDFLWRPRHAGTPRQFECTRLITSAHVARAIALLLPETAPVSPSSRPERPGIEP